MFQPGTFTNKNGISCRDCAFSSYALQDTYRRCFHPKYTALHSADVNRRYSYCGEEARYFVATPPLLHRLRHRLFGPKLRRWALAALKLTTQINQQGRGTDQENAMQVGIRAMPYASWMFQRRAGLTTSTPKGNPNP
jgi:hypothetical protein